MDINDIIDAVYTLSLGDIAKLKDVVDKTYYELSGVKLWYMSSCDMDKYDNDQPDNTEK